MILINELKNIVRDKTSLIFMVAFPVILIYLLGNLLSEQDISDAAIGKIRVAYKIETQDPAELALIDNFMKETRKSTGIVFTRTEKEDTEKEQISQGKLDGLIIFGTEKILLYEGKDEIKNRTIGALVTGYRTLVKSVTTILSVSPDGMGKADTEEAGFVEEKEFNANRTMLDYYGITMVVMLVFIGAIAGASSFGEEIRLKTLNRLIAAPVSRSKIFFQKTIGLIPYAVMDLIIVMMASVIFFDVSYGASLEDNLVLISLFSLSSVTMLLIGVVVGLFIKANPMLVLMPVLWCMMFLGGTFSKELYMEGITNRMPVYIVQQAAFDVTVFGRFHKAMEIMLVEAVLILVLFAIGVLKFNRMKEAR